MNTRVSLRVLSLILPVMFLFACQFMTLAEAQGLPQLTGQGNPAIDNGIHPGGDTIPVSSDMLAPFLPKIPNLELGFLYSFGRNVRLGRFTADYMRPFHLSPDSALFAEAHAEGWEFWKSSPGVGNNRIDLSFGGGYRTILAAHTFLGVNGFYDTSRIGNRWRPSGGVGLEMAKIMGDDELVDLNFNWYGNPFNGDVLVNAFRNGGGAFAVEMGYSHALFDHALDLRLKFAGYHFDVGNSVYGTRSGADLTTKNGMFTLRYEYGNDGLNGQYSTVGGFLNVGFQLENLLSGASPFTMPEPVFKSPRNLSRLLALRVNRLWHHPSAVVAARGALGMSYNTVYSIADPPYRQNPDPNAFPAAYSYVVWGGWLPTCSENTLNLTIFWTGYLGPSEDVEIAWFCSKAMTSSDKGLAFRFTISGKSGSVVTWARPVTFNTTSYSTLSNVYFTLISPDRILNFESTGGISFGWFDT